MKSLLRHGSCASLLAVFLAITLACCDGGGGDGTPDDPGPDAPYTPPPTVTLEGQVVTPDGSDPSTRTLLVDLSTIVRNECRRPDAPAGEPTFDVDTTPNDQQKAAYDLLTGITL